MRKFLHFYNFTLPKKGKCGIQKSNEQTHVQPYKVYIFIYLCSYTQYTCVCINYNNLYTIYLNNIYTIHVYIIFSVFSLLVLLWYLYSSYMGHRAYPNIRYTQDSLLLHLPMFWLYLVSREESMSSLRRRQNLPFLPLRQKMSILVTEMASVRRFECKNHYVRVCLRISTYLHPLIFANEYCCYLVKQRQL